MRDPIDPCIERLYRDLDVLTASSELILGVPSPTCTVDFFGEEPEPLHVFVWGQPSTVNVDGALTGNIIRLSFGLRVTCVATADDPDEARRIANAYRSLCEQVTLCDTTLGGTAIEVGEPDIVETQAWNDNDGRCHAGYLLEYNAAVYVSQDPQCMDILSTVN